MILIRKKELSLLHNTWAWVTRDGVELPPLFTSIEDALAWKRKYQHEYIGTCSR